MTITDRALFLAIPKTGTSWVSQAIKRSGIRTYPPPDGMDGHAPWSEMCPFAGERLVFAIARPCRTWLPSVYRWFRKRHGWRTLPGPCGALRSDEPLEWTDWMDSLAPERVCEAVAAYTSGCDALIRHEHLEADLIRLLGRVGHEFDSAAIRAIGRYNETRQELLDRYRCRWESRWDVFDESLRTVWSVAGSARRGSEEAPHDDRTHCAAQVG